MIDLPPYHNNIPITKNTLITIITQSPEKDKSWSYSYKCSTIPQTSPEHRQSSDSCPLKMLTTETGETLGRRNSRTWPNSLKNLEQPNLQIAWSNNHPAGKCTSFCHIFHQTRTKYQFTHPVHPAAHKLLGTPGAAINLPAGSFFSNQCHILCQSPLIWHSPDVLDYNSLQHQTMVEESYQTQSKTSGESQVGEGCSRFFTF